MNILIVDDEIYSVQGIVNALDWKSLGFENVFTAFSMKQAQKVFEKETVDLLLTDIEMPKGSGLDLIEWANEKGCSPVTLFLTSYAKFEYAQRAIQMQCFGYILKPVEPQKLKEEILRAVRRISMEEMQKNGQSLSKYWNSFSMLRREAFLRDLFDSTIQSEEKIKLEASKCQMPREIMEKDFYYVLVKDVPTDESAEWEKGLLNYAIRNVLSEILCNRTDVAIPDMGDNHFMVLCDADRFDSDEALLDACNRAAKECEKNLPGMFMLFVSGRGNINQAPEYYRSLKTMENDNVQTGTFAISENDFTEKAQIVPEIPVGDWSEALLTHNASKILQESRSYFSRTYSTRPLLEKCYHGIMQTIYTALAKKNIEDKRSAEQAKDSVNILEITESTENFLQWMEIILTKAEKKLNAQSNHGSIVESVHQYVRAHLDDEALNRSKIAAEIHLNPDYLSSVFREKSGQPLSLFIAKERIGKAKKLLITTDLPIKDIYIRTGFSDISYFSKQFKHFVGVTPQQYRKSVFSSTSKPV